jgi:hypothetical protein
MICLHTKIPILVNFEQPWIGNYSLLVHLEVIWYTLWQFGIFCSYFVYFSRFGMLYQEKSRNLDLHIMYIFTYPLRYFLPLIAGLHRKKHN